MDRKIGLNHGDYWLLADKNGKAADKLLSTKKPLIYSAVSVQDSNQID